MNLKKNMGFWDTKLGSTIYFLFEISQKIPGNVSVARKTKKSYIKKKTIWMDFSLNSTADTFLGIFS
jgi:hypothetical protein